MCDVNVLDAACKNTNYMFGFYENDLLNDAKWRQNSADAKQSKHQNSFWTDWAMASDHMFMDPSTHAQPTVLIRFAQN